MAAAEHGALGRRRWFDGAYGDGDRGGGDGPTCSARRCGRCEQRGVCVRFGSDGPRDARRSGWRCRFASSAARLALRRWRARLAGAAACNPIGCGTVRWWRVGPFRAARALGQSRASPGRHLARRGANRRAHAAAVLKVAVRRPARLRTHRNQPPASVRTKHDDPYSRRARATTRADLRGRCAEAWMSAPSSTRPPPRRRSRRCAMALRHRRTCRRRPCTRRPCRRTTTTMRVTCTHTRTQVMRRPHITRCQPETPPRVLRPPHPSRPSRTSRPSHA